MEIKMFTKRDDCPDILDMIRNNHYLKSMCRGGRYYFGLFNNNILVGCAVFGYPTGRMEQPLLELKRFYLTDSLPKNTGSWFMAKCIRQLKTTEYDGIITYADPTQGHEGTLYKASNFQYIGKQKFKTPFFMWKGKRVYSRNVYTGDKYSDIRQAVHNKEVTVQYAELKHKFYYALTNRNNIQRGIN
jgi:hypothetical protein